ncbi:uncharacterized protein [Ptychodera flava]|uniref:uncharacterized protein n=1 Tax=Ptychodera flava TaxID=63121 RepID=UPI00396A8331
MFYTWYIHTSSSSLVKIEFVEFLLRDGDFVEVGDSDQDRSSLGRYNSSYRLPEVPYSRSNHSVVGLSAESVTNPTDGKFRAIFYAVWKCHNNQTVENGYIYPMGEYMYTPGETLALECDQGYYPSTNFTIVTCLEDGTWDGSLSDCIIINCGEPEDIDNADKDGDTFTYNNTVSYTCHDKYVLEDGNGTVVCGEDGEWSDAPTCVPSEKTEDSDSLYIAAVGGVLGVLVLIGFIVAMVLLFRRSKYHQSKTNEPPADNFPSGSTNDSQPMHDSEALQNSQQMNNTKNDRPTTNHTQLNTNPAFDGEIPHPIFSKDIVDDSVHHQTGDNVTGHVYNDIDSKTDSQSGFVENDLYRPCSFGPDSTGARPEFQVKLTDNILYESSDHDMVDSKGDGVYYSAIGNGETVEMKDNIAYESASLRQ